jgi:hypothetical protein
VKKKKNDSSNKLWQLRFQHVYVLLEEKGEERKGSITFVLFCTKPKKVRGPSSNKATKHQVKTKPKKPSKEKIFFSKSSRTLGPESPLDR